MRELLSNDLNLK